MTHISPALMALAKSIPTWVKSAALAPVPAQEPAPVAPPKLPAPPVPPSEVAPSPGPMQTHAPAAQQAPGHWLRHQKRYDPEAVQQNPLFRRAYEQAKTQTPDLDPTDFYNREKETHLQQLREGNPGQYFGMRRRMAESGGLPFEQDEQQGLLREHLAQTQDPAARDQYFEGIMAGQTSPEMVELYRKSVAEGKPISPLDAWRATQAPGEGGLKGMAQALLPGGEGASAEQMEKLKRLEGYRQQGLAPAQVVQEELSTTIADTAGEQLDAFNKSVESGDGSWFDQVKSAGGEFLSDWRNWLVPLGVLGFMFGGKTGKILGALAMAGGAHNIYQRYQGLKAAGEDPEFQKTIQQALAHKNDQGESQPWGNLQQLQQDNPQYAQALGDFTLLSKLGGKNMIADKFVDAALTQGAEVGGNPQSILQKLVASERVDPQRATGAYERWLSKAVEGQQMSVEQAQGAYDKWLAAIKPPTEQGA